MVVWPIRHPSDRLFQKTQKTDNTITSERLLSGSVPKSVIATHKVSLMIPGNYQSIRNPPSKGATQLHDQGPHNIWYERSRSGSHNAHPPTMITQHTSSARVWRFKRCYHDIHQMLIQQRCAKEEQRIKKKGTCSYKTKKCSCVPTTEKTKWSHKISTEEITIREKTK